MSEEKRLTVSKAKDLLNESTGEQWAAIESILAQKAPKGAISKRKGKGGKTFEYVKHGWVTRQLNSAFGHDWDFHPIWESVVVNEKGARIFGSLTVRAGDRTITKFEIGKKEAVPGMWEGDLIASAVSDLLKRCAMRLGVALDLYTDESGPTMRSVQAALASYGKRMLNWDARRTFDYLKSRGFTADDLVDQFEQMHEALEEEAGRGDEPFDEKKPESVDEARQRLFTLAVETGWVTGTEDVDGSTRMLEAAGAEGLTPKQGMLDEYEAWKTFLLTHKPKE